MFKSISIFCERKAFKETLVEYFQKTSLNGFGLLYYIRRRKYQRIFWFCFILLGISFAAYVVVVTLMDFLEDPTVTTLQSRLDLNAHIPFPAIAICSVNKLSRRSTINYVRRLSELSSSSTLPWMVWLDKMHLFAGFYDSEIVVDFDEALVFENQLENLNGNNFSVSEILQRLAPACEDLLLQCFWSENERACKDMFTLRATALGHCCLFNYEFGESKERLSVTDSKQNLTVLLNTSSIDYFYAERNFIGFTIHLFDRNHFPDSSTGEVQEFFISPGEDVCVHLTITTQLSSSDVRSYSPRKRRCFFPDELHHEYNRSYSKAQCLTRCKLQTIYKLCQCVPFYATTNLLGYDFTPKYCSLTDSECLNRYQIAWSNYQTSDEERDSQTMQFPLLCPHCLPLCSYNSYNFEKTVTKLKSETLKEILGASHGLDNFSLLKLYYSTERSIQYREDVIFNWYQILSNIGGVIGICIGCSFISGIEIIYFFGIRYFQNVIRLRKENKT